MANPQNLFDRFAQLCFDRCCPGRLGYRLSTADEPPDALIATRTERLATATTIDHRLLSTCQNQQSPALHSSAAQPRATEQRRDAGCSLATGLVSLTRTDPPASLYGIRPHGSRLSNMPPSSKRSQRARRDVNKDAQVPDSSPSRPAKRRKKVSQDHEHSSDDVVLTSVLGGRAF